MSDGSIQSYEYDPLGNLTEKSDVGIYRYDEGKKIHAVTSIQNDEGDNILLGRLRNRLDRRREIADRRRKALHRSRDPNQTKQWEPHHEDHERAFNRCPRIRDGDHR